MSTPDIRPATVGWFEITTTDPARSQEFYRALLDWKFTALADDDAYCAITAPAAASAMGALRRGERDTVSLGVVCDDVTAAIAPLRVLGATLVEPPARTPAGDVHAVVTDVRGNRLGLFEPGSRYEPEPPAPNATAWFEIGTTDPAATRTFYERAFGWRQQRDEAAVGVEYYGFLPPGAREPIGGVLDLSDTPEAADYAIPGLLVDDVPDLLERCEAGGGRRVTGPFADADGLVIGQFTDPLGIRWSSFSRPAGA
ncbi:VOC family protein [Streptomyces seoulensis]